MQIIERDVEKKLINEMKDVAILHRCLFLQFSKLSINLSDKKTEFVEYMTKYFAGETAKLYISRNSDMFILTRNMRRKQLSQFLALFTKTFVSGPVPSGLAVLFETNINDKKLIGLCLKRIDGHSKLDMIAQKKQKALEQKQQEEALLQTKIDENYIKTIPTRRTDREDITVLLVEDDILTQRLIRNSISKEYDVKATKNGQEAIIAYADIAPDIVFLDIGLPDVCGHKLLNKLLEMDPDAFIVMLSGNGDRQNIVKAVEAGAKGFIGKPFTKDKLVQYIQKSPHYNSKI